MKKEKKIKLLKYIKLINRDKKAKSELPILYATRNITLFLLLKINFTILALLSPTLITILFISKLGLIGIKKLPV